MKKPYSKNMRFGQWMHSNAILIGICFLFVLVYSLIVFFNHYCFRTFALDLGVYTNALYDYAHGHLNDSSSFKEQSRNFLSDHFDVSLILFSPLSYLFGAYTLLIVQIGFVILGGIGVYKVILQHSNDKKLALLALLHLFLFFGIYAALSFDYHSNVIASMLVPWVFLSLQKRNYWQANLLLIAMMLCKESVALWCAGLSLGLIWEFRKDKKTMKVLSVFFVFAMVYFVLVIAKVMPALSPGGEYANYKYKILGTNYFEAIKFIFTHPFDALKYLFVNHSGDPINNGIKAEWFLFMLGSGLFFLIYRPAFLLMLLLPFLSKMWYNEASIWSIDSHYSIEYACLLSIGVFIVISEMKVNKLKRILPWFVCVSSLVISIHLMDHTVYIHDYNRLRLYQSAHYSRPHDIRLIHRELKKIPNTAKVAAQSPLMPHLAYRDHCYMLPLVKDADYIIASEAEPETYPLSKTEMLNLIRDSIQSGRWIVIRNDVDLTVLKRKN